jgi:cytochrome oxidase assembly protein ShyY1
MATNPMGYYMYTPFELQDGGHIVFVNRGWISKGAMEGKGSAPISRPEGALELGQLVVSKGEPRNRFTPSNDEQSIRTKKLLWVEPASLEAAAGLQVTTRRAVTSFVVEKDAEVSASWTNWWFQSAKTATDTTEKTAAAEREDAEKEREELQQLQAMLAEEEEKKAPVEAIIVEVIATDDAIVDSYPVARRYKQLTEFAVAPVTHLTYAATWFSLSAAGFFMTHRLFKGKGNGLKKGGKNVI